MNENVWANKSEEGRLEKEEGDEERKKKDKKVSKIAVRRTR